MDEQSGRVMNLMEIGDRGKLLFIIVVMGELLKVLFDVFFYYVSTRIAVFINYLQ